MRATRITFGHSISGMNDFSSAEITPKVFITMFFRACQTSSTPVKARTTLNSTGGRMTAISGSRPTISVSV